MYMFLALYTLFEALEIGQLVRPVADLTGQASVAILIAAVTHRVIFMPWRCCTRAIGFGTTILTGTTTLKNICEPYTKN